MVVALIVLMFMLVGCAEPTVIKCEMESTDCRCECSATINDDSFIKLSPK